MSENQIILSYSIEVSILNSPVTPPVSAVPSSRVRCWRVILLSVRKTPISSPPPAHQQVMPETSFLPNPSWDLGEQFPAYVPAI
jgi:hypothetical protein